MVGIEKPPEVPSPNSHVKGVLSLAEWFLSTNERTPFTLVTYQSWALKFAPARQNCLILAGARIRARFPSLVEEGNSHLLGVVLKNFM